MPGERRVFSLVPRLQPGNGCLEAPASLRDDIIVGTISVGRA